MSYDLYILVCPCTSSSTDIRSSISHSLTSEKSDLYFILFLTHVSLHPCTFYICPYTVSYLDHAKNIMYALVS